MKTRFFVLAVLCLSATRLLAADGDTVKRLYRTYPNKLQQVQFVGNCKVTIVPDTVEFLEFVDAVAGDKGIPGLMETYSGHQMEYLKLEAQPGVGRMILHLICSGASTIMARDYAQVTIRAPREASLLTVFAHDFSRVELVLSGTDTLCARDVSLHVGDYASINMSVPCVSDYVMLEACDFGKIYTDYIRGTSLTVTEFDEGQITLSGCNDVKKVSVDSDNRRHKEVYEMNAAAATDVRFDLLGGFTNWGTMPFNGLNRMQGDYALDTKFSSFQAEVLYYPYLKGAWAFGVGLGYMSDVYHFSKDYVRIGTADNGLATFESGEACVDGTWSTRLVARYVTMPLTVHLFPTPQRRLVIGLTAVPGLNIGSGRVGLKHKGVFGDDGVYRGHESAADVMNPFKLDARLSVGWKYFYAFVQVPALPLTRGMAPEVYPFKLGLALSLSSN